MCSYITDAWSVSASPGQIRSELKGSESELQTRLGNTRSPDGDDKIQSGQWENRELLVNQGFVVSLHQ